MPPALHKRFNRFSRIQKAFSIALLIQVVYLLIGAATGVAPAGSGLVRAFFIISLILFLVRPFRRLVRKLLWRVRHRLLVTWILLGVVPIVLITALVGEGLFILMGQVVGYMATAELNRENEFVRSTAEALGWSVTHRASSVSVASVVEPFVMHTSQSKGAEVGAIVGTTKQMLAVPAKGNIVEIPKWSKPGFVGLVRHDGRFYVCAHVAAGESPDKTEVFLYRHTPEEFFKMLLPDIATTRLLNLDVNTEVGGVEIRRTERSGSGVSINAGPSGDEIDPDLQPLPAPPGRGWWDIPVRWLVPVPGTDLASGKPSGAMALAGVVSRPSLILSKLFSTLGGLATLAVFAMIVTACVLLIVEIISLSFGAKLTRSITRAVADLYEGTRKVQEGNFSHRIPIRTTDQLSELAGSFNTMTERIERLIVEAKKMERLENEMEIAQDVQAQLFPKEFPKLKTLELWGGCQSARTVSGDYYDFISLGPDRAALAIGDVSGKGISAALLMAHIQSALRSQLMHQNTLGKPSFENGAASPSSILSILNDHLHRSSPAEKYATFFLGLYTDESGQLIYTTAGHLPPMLLRQGQVLRLPGEGFPVGMFPGIQYDQQVANLERGDLVVGFTDGVTEAPSPDGEEFGDQRLAEIIVRHPEKPLVEIARLISASVAAWTGNVERHDDTTLILARRL